MRELIVNTDIELLDLAKSLGRPIASRINGPLIDNLTPLIEYEAHQQSLSANYGASEFPFHTDGAYFKVPPRLIILRYIKGIEDPTPTLFCDLNNLDNKSKGILKHVVWKVKSRKGEFLSTILSENEKIFRYDKCVMRPATAKSSNSKYFENLIEELPKTEIHWGLNKTIIMDNWTLLHSRPEVKNDEINYRTLQRIMIL